MLKSFYKIKLKTIIEKGYFIYLMLPPVANNRLSGLNAIQFTCYFEIKIDLFNVKKLFN